MSLNKTALKTIKTTMLPHTYRHELKYETDFHKAEMIRREMKPMLIQDKNAQADGGYTVKSLYFETPYSDDYTDKELGLQFRQKMRLRSYGTGNTFRLEIKSKIGDVATKYSVLLNRQQAQQIAVADFSCLVNIGTPEALYIYHQLVTRVYRPLMVVSYKRYAYTHTAGNFRLTFDEDMRYSVSPQSLFDDIPMTGIVTDKTVIEVKYDDFVPSWVTDTLLKTGVSAGENSKYAAAFRCIFD